MSGPVQAPSSRRTWRPGSGLLPLLAALAIAGPAPLRAQEPGLRIHGYGEFLYQHFDYGPNQNLPNGSEPDSRAEIGIRRFNLGFAASFARDLRFEAEIEFEHGGAGSALELEYEEFGEYEAEIEKGGEVQLEQIHLTKAFSPAFNLRVGELVLPVGLTNYYHMPTEYLGAVRPESESEIIPLTWHETGVEAFGRVRGFRYQALVVNGLDATGFSSRNWIVEGKQQKFETARATDLAYVGRLDFVGAPGLTVGVSGYYGNTTGNRPKKDMEGIDAHVAIGTLQLLYRNGPLTLRGHYLYGTLENADVVSARNAALSRDIQSARTPVGSAAEGWGGEIGFDVAPLVARDPGVRLIPFVRWDAYDPMARTPEGVFDVPRFDTSLLTVGADFFLTSGVVMKADYAMREVGNGRFHDENTFSLAAAFSETLLF